jgi:hypothetical protein
LTHTIYPHRIHGDFVSPDCAGLLLVTTPELVAADDVRVRERVGYRFTPGAFLGIGTSADVDEELVASPELGWRLRDQGSCAHFIPHSSPVLTFGSFAFTPAAGLPTVPLGWTLW